MREWKEGDLLRRTGRGSARLTHGALYKLRSIGGVLRLYDDNGKPLEPYPSLDYWELVEGAEKAVVWAEGDVLTRVAHSAYFITGKSYEVYRAENGHLRVRDEDGDATTISPRRWVLKEEATKPINEIKKETIMSNVTNVKDLSEYVQRPTLVFGNNIAECNEGELLDLIAKCKEKVEALEDLCPESTKVQNSCIEMENAIIEMVELLDVGEG